MMWYGSGMWGFGWIGMILFWGLIIGLGVLVIWGIAAIARHSNGRPQAGQSLEILKRRLAAGEIDVEQFDVLKRRLELV